MNDQPVIAMTNPKHILVGGGTPVTSSLTGRELLVNTDPTRFRVPACFTPDGAAAAEAAYMSAFATRPPRDRKIIERLDDWSLVTQALATRSPAALADALDPIAEGLLASGKPSRLRGCKPVDLRRGPMNTHFGFPARVVELLVALWRHGCVLAPIADFRLGLFFGARWMPGKSEAFYGSAANLLGDLEGAAGQGLSEAFVNRAVLSVHGVQGIGDMSEEVLRLVAEATRESAPEMEAAADALVPGLFNATARSGNIAFRAGCNSIASAQRVAYAAQPDVAAKVPQTYSHLRPERVIARSRANATPTRDKSFSWIGRDFPECAAWQTVLAEYLESMSGLLDARPVLSSLAMCTRAILEADTPPATPIDACRQAQDVAPLLKARIEQGRAKPVTRNGYVNAVRGFFDWVIKAKARRPDGTLDTGLGNPADLLPNYGKHTRKAQTDRPKMPGWLLQKAAEVLSANDYEWPRSREADYFEVVEDGQVKKIWSPVLAELTRLRFVLPIRGTQARLLGSGEGDSWVWVPGDELEASAADETGEKALTTGRWVRNTSIWAPPPTEERALGLLRRIFDPEEGTWTNGLYISTNKTKLKSAASTDFGHEIPWVNGEILGVYNRTLRFQQRYNPAKAPKSRAELTMEPAVITDEAKALMPRMHYLFRDASHVSSADEPVTTSRVKSFWLDLLDEVERRCAEDPDVPRNEDGSPPVLILRRDRYGRATKARYDLHCVRVTGLTRLALGGCPVQVLMMLAGHATWIMTLYYVKMTPGDVRRALDEAEARVAEIDEKDLEEALACMDPEKLQALNFAMSDEGAEQLRDADVALMASSDLGLCPNGGTLCHIGGKPVSTAGSTSLVCGPVPGGATNCQSCRYLVSGPQFLVGILARLNAQAVKVIAAGERLREAEENRRALVAERRRAEADATPALQRRLRRAKTNLEAAEAHAEDVAERWTNLYRLFDRCLTALQELMRREDAGDPSGGRHLLVLNGRADDVRAGLQRCTDMTLWNRVCLSSEVVESVDATQAATRRGMRLDHLLAQSGKPAVFAGLTDRERVAVGNEMARWMETRLGPAGADEIYEGRRTLAEAGLLDDLDMVLPNGAPRASVTTLPEAARALLPSGTS